MLFSSSEVADYINETFEPAWESVRPAPLVTIDFGNGRTIKRTPQGNIATHICTPTGIVCDVLPGIYTPLVYRRQLELLNELVSDLRDSATDEQAAYLRQYHEEQGELLRQMELPPPLRNVSLQKTGFIGGASGFKGGALGFAGIEGPTVAAIVGQPDSETQPIHRGPLDQHPVMALDALVGERIRRRVVHERLAQSGRIMPAQIKDWLFKEVLHTDVADETLGLSEALNKNYPFVDEDRPAAKR